MAAFGWMQNLPPSPLSLCLLHLNFNPTIINKEASFHLYLIIITTYLHHHTFHTFHPRKLPPPLASSLQHFQPSLFHLYHHHYLAFSLWIITISAVFCLSHLTSSTSSSRFFLAAAPVIFNCCHCCFPYLEPSPAPFLLYCCCCFRYQAAAPLPSSCLS